MNKKKLLIAFLLAFSMTTGISYAEEENIISPKVEINDEQLNPENSSKQENSTEKADQTERTKNNQMNNQKRKNTRKFLRTKT